ncbi:hypothetical protein [Micromonospora sp. WMMD980]|uniref:hypothetical protein n=1 Tax=Micromonospora sp. WMMD980 TaxID=3016088 RepID=UPI002416A0C8|nr:hypothetical protein [Micromonospora sp. WMMD980]MDG4801703.1 hypothetical protein [Micromonospora sp. WMMD980]
MTPDEALIRGREYVAEVAKLTDEPASPDKLADVALSVAAFLVEYGEPEADDEAPAQLDISEAMPAGPARRVMCSATPGDFAYVRSGRVGARPFVHVEVHSDGELAAVALALAEARAYAAGILDACDEAEGGSPLLVFQPRQEAAE